MQDAQSRLLDKESEIGKLRDLLSSASVRRSALGAAAGRAGSGAHHAPADDLSARRQQQQPLHSRRGGAPRSLAAVTLPDGGGGAGGSRGVVQLHESTDSLPLDLSQIQSFGLPSPPSTLMLPEAVPSPLWREGRGGGLGGVGSPSWLGAGRPTNATAAAAAAARAEMYLRASKDDLDELLRLE